MATVSLEPIDSVTITTLVDNVSDLLLRNEGPAHRPPLVDDSMPRLAAPTLEWGEAPDIYQAEHGFSALITFAKDGTEHRVLFDTGLTPNGVVENMRRLSLSPKDIEIIVLSHGHFDHTIGLSGLIDVLGGTVSLPVMIHPEFWSRRRIAIPGSDATEIPSTSKSALLGAGFEIIEEKQPSFLFDDSLLITGEVDRTNEFEKGFAVHQAFHDGAWPPDPLILDDEALIMHVRDKGLVVLTGCRHAGIVNIVHYAQKLTGVDEVYAVIGGFHLSGPLFEPIIPAFCDALAKLSPDVIVPARCTYRTASAHGLSYNSKSLC